MKFQLTPGGMLFTADQSPEDVHELLKFFKLSITEHLTELVAGHMEYLHKAPWFEVCTILGSEWLAPYLKRLEIFTDTPVPDHTPLPWNEYDWPICHTHLVTKAWFEDGCYISEGYIRSQDWNGQSAEVRADKNYVEYVRDFVGHTMQEPEYIMGNYGRKCKNPRYLLINRAKPALNSKRLFTALLKATATPGQLAAFERYSVDHVFEKLVDTNGYSLTPEEYRAL